MEFLGWESLFCSDLRVQCSDLRVLCSDLRVLCSDLSLSDMNKRSVLVPRPPCCKPQLPSS